MRIYLTNLGKYNEGQLVGQWVELPVEEEELKKVKRDIGIDERYEEWFITDWEDSPIEVEEYDSVKVLNEIATAYEEMNDTEKEVYEFMIKYQGIEWQEALELIKNSEYLYYDNIEDDSDLGHRIAEEWEIPQKLECYINYESIGRDSQYNEGWTRFKKAAILLLK